MPSVPGLMPSSRCRQMPGSPRTSRHRHFYDSADTVLDFTLLGELWFGSLSGTRYHDHGLDRGPAEHIV